MNRPAEHGILKTKYLFPVLDPVLQLGGGAI
jgi:hypothetical protein